ncbi:hypothetical protein IAU60_004756 [Kwoniella sp. DSM 27419]
MEAAIQAHIESAIDPALVDQDGLSSAPLTPAPLADSGDKETLLEPTPTPRNAKGRSRNAKVKTKAAAPGSSADFRRREANRLAAERSRSRQHEKVVALESTSKLLTEENARLHEQIAQLGGHDHEGAEPHGPSIQGEGRTDITAEEITQGLNRVVDQGTNAPSLVAVDHHSAGDQPTQTQEQEAHSHTILAALTDITGVDFSEGNEASWMQGMENFLKDSEASGRLGELAAVATGGGEDTTSNTDNRDGPAVTSESPAVHDASEEDLQREPGAVKRYTTQPPSPAHNAMTVVAAAINTEMERLIMEDLADTKAAIVKIERQLAALRGEGTEMTGEDSEVDPAAFLPASVLSEDMESLKTASMTVQNDISRIQGELPDLHDEMLKLRGEKIVEENKVIELVKEVKDSEIENEEEKIRFLSAIKAVGGFVKDLLSDEAALPAYASGSYSSPAIARRRRGRPPKGDINRTFYQSFLLNWSPSGPSRSDSSETEQKAKTRANRKPRKSRLGQQIQLPDGETREVERDLRQLQEQAQAAEDAEGATGEVQDTSGAATPMTGPIDSAEAELATLPHAAVEQEDQSVDHSDQDATVEAVSRAEAFILSQLASQEQQAGHDGQDHMPPLDSTNFADFLPAQEELERQAEQETIGHVQGLGHDLAGHHGAPHSADSAAHGGADALQSQDQQRHTVLPATESVLARLKKGPPGSCDICTRTETTVWRKLVLGTQDLKVCNACGTYHHKFGVIRPPELWDDGKSIRRRRTGPRPSTAPEGENDEHRPRKKARKGRKGARYELETGPEAEAEQDRVDGLSEEGRRVVLDDALIRGLDELQNAGPVGDIDPDDMGRNLEQIVGHVSSVSHGHDLGHGNEGETARIVEALEGDAEQDVDVLQTPQEMRSHDGDMERMFGM